MTISAFPQVPTSRNQLSPQDVASYVTQPAYANDLSLQTEITALTATVSAIPNITRSASVPSTGTQGDIWVDTATSNQLLTCDTTYSAGDASKEDNWSNNRDVTTLAIANAAPSAANIASTTIVAAFPSSYTQGWIYVNSSTGAAYACTTTYTEATAEEDRPSKFKALTDAVATAAVTSAQSAIDDIADDSKITPDEKNLVYREWSQIEDNKTAMDTLATNLSLTLNADYVAAVAAYDALDLYLNTTITVFNDLTSTTDLVAAGTTRTAWNTKWETWYSTSATFSKTASSSMKTSIDLTQSDETITEAEARDYEVTWTYETENYTNHEATIDALVTAGLVVKATNTEWQAYLTAYNALDTYLNTTLQLFINTTWPMVLSDEGSSAAEWRTKWATYSEKERAMSSLGNTTLSAAVDSYANDGKIDAQEKRGVTQAWNIIHGSTGANGEYQLLRNRAATLIAAGYTSLSAKDTALGVAFDDLDAYLTSLGANLWDPTAADVEVVNSTWDDKWQAYYLAYADLDQVSAAISDVGAGLSGGLIDDEVITAGKEKQTLIELFKKITIEYTNLITKANLVSGTSTTVYTEKYEALRDYLYGMFTDVSGFENMGMAADGISRGVWMTNFDAYYEAREGLETDIINQITTSITRDSAAIPNMATDGDITSEEKYVALQYWTIIYGTADNGEHANLVAQATSLSVAGASITAFTDSFTLLWNFLTDDSHGAPNVSSAATDLFTSMGVTKTLTSAQQAEWQTDWSDYYAQRDIISGLIITALQTNLTAKLSRDGSLAMTGALDMGSFAITNLAAGSAAGNAATYGQLDTLQSEFDSHATDTTNVHSVTAAQASAFGIANNLSELVSVAAARTNLGLGSASVLTAGTAYGNVPIIGSELAGSGGSRWLATNNSGQVLIGILTANQVLTTDGSGLISSATKATGFNKALGTGAGTVAEGNHTHPDGWPTLSFVHLAGTLSFPNTYSVAGVLTLTNIAASASQTIITCVGNTAGGTAFKGIGTIPAGSTTITMSGMQAGGEYTSNNTTELNFSGSNLYLKFVRTDDDNISIQVKSHTGGAMSLAFVADAQVWS